MAPPSTSKPKHFTDVPREKRQERNIKNYFTQAHKDALQKIKNEVKLYEIVTQKTKNVPKFGITENITKIVFKNIESKKKKNMIKTFKNVIQKLISDAYEKNLKADWKIEKFSIDIYCEAIYDPVVIPARTKEENTIDVIFNAFIKLQQSFKDIDLLDQELSINVTTYSIPIGTGRRKFNPFQYFPCKDLGKISIINGDNKCLFYALEMTRLYQIRNTKILDAISDDSWRRLSKNTKRQTEYANNLIKAAKINPNEKSYGLREIILIQKYWEKIYPQMFRIVVFSQNSGLRPIYKGERIMRYDVSIFHNGSHWDGLKSVNQFFPMGNAKLCIDCEVTYCYEEEHRLNCTIRCPKCCRMGYGFPCNNDLKIPVTCKSCNRDFFNKNCYEAHENKVCKLYHYCSKCKKEYNTKQEKIHICGMKYCKICDKRHKKTENCYINRLKNKKDIHKYMIAAYDLECTTDNILQESEGKTFHKPNFVSVHFTCNVCDESLNECRICGKLEAPRHLTWCSVDNIDPLSEFLKWILKQEVEVYAFAHYAGRYDSHFVLRELTNQGYTPELIIADLKIYEITIRRFDRNIYFRDTWLLTQNKLADLPKTFDLKCQAKLYFPHKMNREENYGKIMSKLPPLEAYPTNIKNDEYEIMKKWYYEHINDGFQLEKELNTYCSNDSQILIKTVLKLRKIFLKITTDEETPKGIDILKDARTIASGCIKIYQAKFLKEKCLPIVPERGFEIFDNQSSTAIKYFEWIMYRDKIKGRHAANGGEVVFKGYKVDFISNDPKKIIEFQGCAFHGCPKCFMRWEVQPNGKTAYENYKKTQAKISKIEEAAKKCGFIVEEVWECDVKQMLSKNKKMSKFFNEVTYKTPIIPREAFFGGRTGPLCIYDKSDEKHEIGMVDIVSLYPYINYTAKYPIGIPKIIKPKDMHVKWSKPEELPYDGLLKVRVIAPKNLKMPLLPARIDDMLLFANCLNCAKMAKPRFMYVKNVKKCSHKENKRAFYGTFTSVELKKALSLGYKIDRFYRAYEYEKFDVNLFKGYVRKFLKIKIEASGFPAHINTVEKKQNFIEMYKEVYGIELDIDNIKLNPGMRHIAKLALNSLWGKFSMRNNLSKNKIVDNPSEFFKILMDPKLEMAKPIVLGDNKLRIIYQEREEFIVENKTSNVIVSLWTTSMARLKLYEYMEIVANSPGCKVLYTDTDSIIYKFPNGKNPIKCGEFLGEMSQEYAECHIIEYVSAGPKQYALMLKNKTDGKIWYKTKIRGITMDKNNHFEYEDFKNMVLNYKEGSKKSFTYNEKFGPTRESHVITRKVKKDYEPVQRKGLIDENYDVLPFGFY